VRSSAAAAAAAAQLRILHCRHITSVVSARTVLSDIEALLKTIVELRDEDGGVSDNGRHQAQDAQTQDRQRE